MACAHCPLADKDRACPGEKNPAVCRRADPSDPGHKPSIVAKILSFTGAAVAHVAAGMPTASPEVKAARLAICGACEKNDNGRCAVCDCPAKGVELRASWAEQSCPLDPPRW